MAHKYRAKPTTVDGVRFASQAEARRYAELKLLEKAGEIRELRLQPSFELLVPLPAPQTNRLQCIGKYVADFAYIENGYRPILDREVVEDVKGMKTPMYRWKKKHVEAQYGIQIREITRR